MNKNHTTTLLVVSLITLIVTIIGASYAYFASLVDVSDSTPVGAQTEAASSSFISTSTGGINIDVTSDLMQENNSNDNDTLPELTSASELSISLSSPKNGVISTCHYNIIFEWADEADEYIKTTGAIKEFTIMGKAQSVNNIPEFSEEDPNKDKFIINKPELTEINIDELNWQVKNNPTTNDESSPQKEIKYAILVEDAVISSLYQTKPTVVNWNFEVKFYNLTKVQTNLKNKYYGGEIKIDPSSIKC